jgi:hypothetical protein
MSEYDSNYQKEMLEYYERKRAQGLAQRVADLEEIVERLSKRLEALEPRSAFVVKVEV